MTNLICLNFSQPISGIAKDRSLIERVNMALNTMPFRNHKGNKIKYLNRMYQDMPLISVLAHIKSKEKSILEFENDFLKNIQLNE